MKDEKFLTDKQIDGLTFEEALERLEQIVDKLELGEVPLETAIDLFQEGMKLAKKCHLKLGNIEMKIESLLEKDGEFIKKPFTNYDDEKE